MCIRDRYTEQELMDAIRRKDIEDSFTLAAYVMHRCQAWASLFLRIRQERNSGRQQNKKSPVKGPECFHGGDGGSRTHAPLRTYRISSATSSAKMCIRDSTKTILKKCTRRKLMDDSVNIPMKLGYFFCIERYVFHLYSYSWWCSSFKKNEAVRLSDVSLNLMAFLYLYHLVRSTVSYIFSSISPRLRPRGHKYFINKSHMLSFVSQYQRGGTLQSLSLIHI